MKTKKLETILDSFNMVYISSLNEIDINEKKIFILPHTALRRRLISRLHQGSQVIIFRLPTKNRPRFLVRLDKTEYYRDAINFLNPGGLLAKLYIYFLRAFSYLKLKPSTLSMDFIVLISKNYCRDSSDFSIEFLLSEIMGIYIGTDDVNRKLVAYINSAKSGKIVSLVSSGDPGIYGMAGLIYETLAATGWEPSDELKVEFGKPVIRPHQNSTFSKTKMNNHLGSEKMKETAVEQARKDVGHQARRNSVLREADFSQSNPLTKKLDK